MPLVSVVLPTYNRARTLRRAVQSVLRQTMSDLELLVVDDGSTDDTAQCLAAIGDPRMRVLTVTKRGVAAARNVGIAAAQAPFIAFQDSDDEWAALKLEKQLPLMQKRPDIGLVYSAVLRWDGTRVLYIPSGSDHPRADGDLSHIICWRNIAPTPAWLVRRECFERVGLFDESMPPVEDWEWMIRFSRQNHAHLIDEPLVTVYQSEDSISQSHGGVARALSLLALKHEAHFRHESPQALAHLHLRAGVRACLSGDFVAGRLSFIRGLSEQPWGVKFPLAWVLSFAGTRAMNAGWRLARRLRWT